MRTYRPSTGALGLVTGSVGALYKAYEGFGSSFQLIGAVAI